MLPLRPAAALAAAPMRHSGDDGRSDRRPGRIGPNAIIRMAEALDAEIGTAATRRLFAGCGLAGYLDASPEHMIDEREVARLHAAIGAELGPDAAGIVCRSAGARTADYLLAKRIPRAAQWLLRALPARSASRLLLATIERNAWTFVGSGRLYATAQTPAQIVIVACPLCRDMSTGTSSCAYYAATFERLYRMLVHPDAVVREVRCAAAGSSACEFELRWP